MTQPPTILEMAAMSAPCSPRLAGGEADPQQNGGYTKHPMSNELAQLVEDLQREEEKIRSGGGRRAIERQHAKGRLTARERIDRLIDPGTTLFELGLWAAWGMYREW